MTAVGVERRAVVERHPLADLERQRQAVGAVLPRLGEARDRVLDSGVEVHEAVVRQEQRQAVAGVGGAVGVHPARLVVVPEAQHAGGVRGHVARRGRGRVRHRGGGCRAWEPAAALGAGEAPTLPASTSSPSRHRRMRWRAGGRHPRRARCGGNGGSGSSPSCRRTTVVMWRRNLVAGRALRSRRWRCPSARRRRSTCGGRSSTRRSRRFIEHRLRRHVARGHLRQPARVAADAAALLRRQGAARGRLAVHRARPLP